MNKKIKVIDLLLKYTKREQMPKKIKIDNNVFVYNVDDRMYWLKNSHECIYFKIVDLRQLDYEVEILEDNTDEIEEYKGETFEQLGYEVGKMSLAIINGLERAIKEMRKEKK